MRAIVVGAGAVGARAARQLTAPGPVDDLVVTDVDRARADAIVNVIGAPARAAANLTEAVVPGAVVVLATPSGQRALAEVALGQGAHVVSVNDNVSEVHALLTLDAEARHRNLHVVVGAGFSPGLSCLLVAHAARSFERVEEVHVSKVGTGGPACARQHHRSLNGPATDWHDGEWARRRSGSGRQLVWFPDPVRGVDCYRAALAEVALLVPAFPGVERVTARLGANRRDRLTARLPMLRKPHPEGGLGALRVEVRGAQGQVREDKVLGAVDRPAVAAGAVSAVAACWALERRLTRTGAAGLATLADPSPFLATLADRGVKAAIFEGDRTTAGVSADEA